MKGFHPHCSPRNLMHFCQKSMNSCLFYESFF
ncbi:unnamed protein product [Spirodela intermedia]|uniref:Uncharacterized protein n=2 Tax=Spirodela intermedia TaxID=51605 RepID=A0A7I8KKN2_SPIIN|nr:unnamed protein product [Spirodela intermedia]CAA6661280.1 unnamed protein product [Spirodela intermedia]CAA7397648.1 unnamed protein product [Spirodela intermedia]